MKTTAQLMAMAQQNLPLHGLSGTKYRLAKYLGISHSLTQNYLDGDFVWSNQTAIKCCELLPYPAEIVLLWAAMEREKNPEARAVLQRIEDKLQAA